MIRKFFYWIDRLCNSVMLRFRKEVFLSKIGSKEFSVQVLGKIYINASNIRIGKNVTIYPNVYFWGDGLIEIGDNVDIGVGTIIFSKNKIKIGNNTSIAGQCYIIDSNHSTEKMTLINQQPLDIAENGILIGSDVWIAAGCKIVKGALINDGCVVGALSLVNSEIPIDGIAVGIPAKTIKFRI